MAIERKELGTDTNPDVMPMGNAMTVIPEPSRQDQIRQAAEILVADDAILIDDEIDAPVMEAAQAPFTANLVDQIDDADLMVVSKEILAGIEQDKESRAEWERTYLDGLKYLGMKFDEARTSPFQGSTGVIHPILAEAVTQFQAQAYKDARV